MRILLFIYSILFFSIINIYGQDSLLYKKQEDAFRLIFENREKAIVLIDSLISEYEHVQTHVQGKNLSNKGVYYAVQNQLDSSIYYFEQALHITEKDHVFYPNLSNNLAIVYKKKGYYEQALDVLVEALNIAKQQDNFEALGKLYSETASLYRSLNQYDLAIEYSLKSIEVDEQNNGNQKFIYNKKQRLANLYSDLGNYAFAKDIYEEIIPYYNKTIFIDAKVSTYLNHAAALIELNDFDKAKDYLEKCEQIFRGFHNEELHAFYHLIYGNYHNENKNFIKAELFYKNALGNFNKHLDNYPKSLNTYLTFLANNNRYEDIINYSTEFKALENFKNIGLKDLIDYNFLMAKAYEKKGAFKKASTYYQSNYVLQDSLQKQVNFAVAKDLQAKYQNEIISQNNIILKQRLNQERKIKSAIIAFGVLIAVILVLITLKSRNKTKYERKLNEALSHKIVLEKKLTKFKDDLIQEQKKELLSRALDANHLKNDFRKLKSSEETSMEVNEKITSIENLISPEHQLQKIKFEFNRLYPNFKVKLKEKYPELSKSELLFLTLIKLNFSFKEMAVILKMSYKSVISKKYRISKKMKLRPKEDLYEIIQTQF